MSSDRVARPTSRWRRLRSGLLLVVVAVLVWQGLHWSRYLHLASGYAAKVAASGVFLAGRDLEELKTHELKPFAILDLEIDRERREVHASAFGLFGQTARYRDGLGATLVQDGRELSGPEMLALPSDETASPWSESLPSAEDPASNPQLVKMNRALEFGFKEFDEKHPRNTRAILVVHRGQLIAERYGDQTDRETPLHGWSMTKTVLGTLCGLAVGDGLLDLSARAPVAEWADDERSGIRLEHVLRMTTGLDFQESYSDPGSDALEMLFDSYDMAAFVATRPPAHPPGTHWSYSSGDSLLLSGILKRAFGAQEMFTVARDRLFAKLGMTSAVLEFDGSGTIVGSSMCWATARDWARFGEFLRLGGRWNGEQILPPGYVDWMRTPTDGSERRAFGAHLWLNAGIEGTDECAWPGLPRDLFWCAGFEGQYVVVAPTQQAVIVRLGQTFGQPEYQIDELVSAVLSALPE